MADSQISRLLALPLELRERIYINCFNDNPLELHTDRPNEPNITRVSKVVRQECLPLFYSRYPLSIKLDVDCTLPRGPIVIINSKWYHRLSDDKIRHVRIIRLYLVFHVAFWGDLGARTNFEIRLDRGKAASNIRFAFGLAPWRTNPVRHIDPPFHTKGAEIVQVQLQENIAPLLKEPGIGSWGSAELDRLLEVHAQRWHPGRWQSQVPR